MLTAPPAELKQPNTIHSLELRWLVEQQVLCQLLWAGPNADVSMTVVL